MKKSHHLFVIITKNTYFCPRNETKGYLETYIASYSQIKNNNQNLSKFKYV